MSSLRFKLSVALMVICTASYVAYLEVQASEESDEQIGFAAVWPASDEQLLQINRACAQSRTQDYAQCFIAQMPGFGASEEAVSFTRDYAEHNHGTIAILRGFHPMDAVDLGYVYFPAADEFRQGWLLLNGMPSVINVDDLNRLPQSAMEKDPGWTTLRSRYPQMKFFFDGSERKLDASPEMQTLPDGGQRFIIEYPLRNGCGSCALLGHAIFSFDFDGAGELVTVRFVSVTPT
jgi:hypothetical protein